MALTSRIFVLDADDSLFRLPNSKFMGMLGEPRKHRCPAFAGQRVRSAEVILELENRKPVRVVRTYYCMLSFDQDGCFDLEAYSRFQNAHVESTFSASDAKVKVVDAASRFVLQGGNWSPAKDVVVVIHNAALGGLECKRA